MGKDKRLWRKLVKKLRRKRIRSEKAQKRDNESKKGLDCQSGNRNENESYITSNSEDEEIHNLKIEEAKWFERERQAQLHFEMKKAEENKRLQQEQDEKERIRKEWDELEAKREAHEKEMKELDDEKREKQDKEFNEFLDFLAGDIETPPLPFLMPEDPKAGEQAICPFFARTAACRFSVNCTRAHPRPTLSQIILIPNFFSHFALEQALLDEYDTDLILEYEDSELYKAFLEFYEDVMPEFKSVGEVIQFKVCCNLESHLRGNVYVQYKDIRQAVEAYRLFNGRFYNGRQLSLQFVKIDSWRSSICGLFTRKRCLLKRSCYFLHVFRNPTKEFVGADNDWKQLVRANSKFPIRPLASASSTAVSTCNYSTSSSSRDRERSSSRASRSSARDSSRSTRDEIQTKSSRAPVPVHRDSPGKRRHSDDDTDYKHREHRHRYESHRKWDRTEAHNDKYLSLSYESDRNTTSKTNSDQDRVNVSVSDSKQPQKKKLKSKKEKKEKHKKHKKKKKDNKKSKKKEKSESSSSGSARALDGN